MPHVGIRELQHNAAGVVRRVEEGERLVITRQNRPVAVLVGMAEVGDFVFTFAEEFVERRREGESELEDGEWVAR